MDEQVSSLFEHIKNRLDTTYEYGDVGQVIKDKKPNHAVWEQSIREDCQGDVGIFEITKTELSNARGMYLYEGEIQIVVVCKSNDLDNAKTYLKNTLKNLRTNYKSNMFIFKNVKLLNLRPMGKNKVGNQMVVLNIQIMYVENTV